MWVIYDFIFKDGFALPYACFVEAGLKCLTGIFLTIVYYIHNDNLLYIPYIVSFPQYHGRFPHKSSSLKTSLSYLVLSRS